MTSTTGILFALGALIGWALGDFSIQRAVRAVGNVRALFYIGALGAIGILPFVWNEIVPALSDIANWPLIGFACVLVAVTALVNFQGLKLGKLSVVLPMNGIELVIAVLLAVAAGHESYSFVIYGHMLIVATGLVLTSVRSLNLIKKIKWEKGVAIALAGAVGLGISNFTIGITSIEFSPLLTIWLTHTACAICTLFIMLKRSHLSCIRNDFKRHFNVIMAQSFLDNLAWISFAYATTIIPIGIATTISEGYLALGTLLGIIVNRERLRWHQYAGIALTLIGVIALSYLTA
ncbi:MAG: DMT family transporter [Patescibacteria group bacterium]